AGDSDGACDPRSCPETALENADMNWLRTRIHFDKRMLRTLILLLILFSSMIIGIEDLVRGVESVLLWFVVFMGLFVGWWMASSKIRGWATALLSAGLGIAVTVIFVGRLGLKLAYLIQAFFLFILTAIRWLIQQTDFVDSTVLVTLFQDLNRDLSIIIARLLDWISNLWMRQPSFDPIAIGIVWGLAFFAVSIWASWVIRRHQKPAWAMLPALMLMAVSLGYVNSSAYTLLPMLGASLALILTTGYDASEQQWMQQKLDFATDIRFDIAVATLVLSLGLTITAGIMPSISVQDIADAYRDWLDQDSNQTELGESLGLDPEPLTETRGLDIFDQMRDQNELPTSHLIGTGEELAEVVVMLVRVETPGQGEATEAPVLDSHYYWRNLTYDRYTGSGWTTGSLGKQNFSPGEFALPVDNKNHRLLRQEIRIIEDLGNMLYSAGSLVTTDQDFQVAWRLHWSDDLLNDIFGATTESDLYRVDSLQPVFSETELRAVDQRLPPWVIEHYIHLPESIPERVLVLARELTATEPTEYDRALAIESFLRQFPYTLDVPPPPQTRDIVDYFIFDLKKGYCDYYASAMVVLARAAGLPARLVTGFVSGNYNQENDTFIVTADQAHAWVEIYFPEYGWIPFEPTGGRNPIDRPKEISQKIFPDWDQAFEPITAPRFTLMRTLWGYLGLSAFLLIPLGWAAWLGFDRWWLGRLPVEDAVQRVYWRLYKYGLRLGVDLHPETTPLEFSKLLVKVLGRFGTDNHAEQRWAAPARELLESITDDYLRVLYFPEKRTLPDQKHTLSSFTQLRWRLILLSILLRIKSLTSSSVLAGTIQENLDLEQRIPEKIDQGEKS
ncbi:MAG: transglutaminase domain-containing protein, partial [Chloroflexota bacterium]